MSPSNKEQEAKEAWKERIKELIKGSILARIWDYHTSLVKTTKPKNE